MTYWHRRRQLVGPAASPRPAHARLQGLHHQLQRAERLGRRGLLLRAVLHHAALESDSHGQRRALTPDLLGSDRTFESELAMLPRTTARASPGRFRSCRRAGQRGPAARTPRPAPATRSSSAGSRCPSIARWRSTTARSSTTSRLTATSPGCGSLLPTSRRGTEGAGRNVEPVRFLLAADC